MTHQGCVWDYPEDVVLVYGKVRGIRLVLASLYDDDDAVLHCTAPTGLHTV
jgi:hypothetical protein